MPLCHHADLAGQPPSVPSLVELGARLDRDQLATMVTHGKGLMPAFPGMSKDDLAHSRHSCLVNRHGVAAKSGMKGTKPVERYRSGFGFMLTSNGLSPIAPPWTSLDRLRFELRGHPVENPAGRCAGAGGQRDHRDWNPLSQVSDRW